MWQDDMHIGITLGCNMFSSRIHCFFVAWRRINISLSRVDIGPDSDLLPDDIIVFILFNVNRVATCKFEVTLAWWRPSAHVAYELFLAI